ncbi:large ribosomal subunit protein bL28m [Petromyzon marinus]|uniref:Large ribosomal subunit protein bL28m n=1 Tax=Petromyzon marinus TaxID=7757 RepID=S4RHD2_PETMA|nr:39S ribosomal protein L28, mitochondrial [Petromyzon marinus]
MPLHKYPPKMWEALKLQRGVYARLPQHYRDSLVPRDPTPVHYVPGEDGWKSCPRTGRRWRVQRNPAIPVHYPRESQNGLWGGEGWLYGFTYSNNEKLSRKLRRLWKPQLFKRDLYSEILDHTFSVTVTMRTLDLIDNAYGFDFYILKTPKEDLNSKFGMELKRTLLLRLARKDTQLYPDDPVKREFVYDKYKEFVVPEEEAEWVGLSLVEAVEKQRQIEKKDVEPLFKVYVRELVEKVTAMQLQEPAVVVKNERRS